MERRWDPDTQGHRLAGMLLTRIFRRVLKSDVFSATLESFCHSPRTMETPESSP
jgi:hypothetical protein